MALGQLYLMSNCLYADQLDKPITYASRSLNTVEQKYSQLDKETLAVLFGVSKFHHYLYGKHFVIYSDKSH